MTTLIAIWTIGATATFVGANLYDGYTGHGDAREDRILIGALLWPLMWWAFLVLACGAAIRALGREARESRHG